MLLKCPICHADPRMHLHPYDPFDLKCANFDCFNVEPVTARTWFGLRLKWNRWCIKHERDYKRLERRAAALAEKGE